MAGKRCNGFVTSQLTHPIFRIKMIQSTQTGAEPRASITGENAKILRFGIQARHERTSVQRKATHVTRTMFSQFLTYPLSAPSRSIVEFMSQSPVLAPPMTFAGGRQVRVQ